MKAGQLRYRVDLQNKTKAGTPLAEKTETWATYATRWAAIEPLIGRELFAVQQTSAEATTRIRLRYLDDVSVQDRVVFGDRTFAIVSAIDLDTRHIELHLMCKEVPA